MIHIGEFLNCTHGPDGERKLDCVECAIGWHVQQREIALATVQHHTRALAQLQGMRAAQAQHKADGA
jgi:hypothetical protein